MTSKLISQELKESLKRNNLGQKELGDRVHRTRSTINGYVHGREQAPLDAMTDIAEAMEDDLLNQDFAHLIFHQLPSMKSDVFKDCPHTYEFIQMAESDERKKYKQSAMLALTKNKESLEKDDRDAIWNYAMNFLDEIFVEVRYVISLFNLLDMSLMAAIKQRKPHWKNKKYMRS